MLNKCEDNNLIYKHGKSMSQDRNSNMCLKLPTLISVDIGLINHTL